MTCGEGGGAVNDYTLAERARCTIDPCHFYWQGRNDEVKRSREMAREPPN